MKPAQVLCIGEALIDRLGPLGSIEVLANESEDRFGGAPANVACALAKLGSEVSLIGAIGNDLIGQNFQDLLDERGVSIEGLQVDNKRPTRIVLVTRDDQGDRTFGGFEGDFGEGFADQFIDQNILKDQWNALSVNAKWLLIGTIPLASIISSESLRWVVDVALKTGIQIGLDVNWRPTFWDKSYVQDLGPNQIAIDKIAPILKSASLIKLAKEEAVWFFNTDDPLGISKQLPREPDVLVTDGAKPVKWLLNNNYGQKEVIQPRQIIDTTGAGDAFMSGIIFKLLSTCRSDIEFEKAEEIVEFAMACGAFVCGGLGAIEAQPTFDDVSKLIS